MSSGFSQEQLSQQLMTFLGEKLSPKEVMNCLKEVEIVEPPVAKLFWQSTDSQPGIYIVLAGKVRLLDSSGNLISTLAAGSSFGEVTLFAEEGFIPYAARASHNLKLCYISADALQILMEKYPKIRDRLLKSTELWDLQLLYQNQHPNTPVHNIFQAFSLFERHSFNKFQEIEVDPDTKLWLLHRGKLQRSDGSCLTSGKIYAVPQDTCWQATQPTILYSLRNSAWLAAVQHLPQLTELIASDSKQITTEENEAPPQTSFPQRRTNSRKVIPFPSHAAPPKQKRQRRVY
ncbi:cyclic nucleotide-binding domain-containing protein, partial [Brasilonema bromeliae]|uniref:cyclic nucleotide-binding domain-containing protein n=1 Tax=Brasilonema bromeliae TaxID=383615 RepID=UPI001FECBF32